MTLIDARYKTLPDVALNDTPVSYFSYTLRKATEKVQG